MLLDTGSRLTAIRSTTAIGCDVSSSGGNFLAKSASLRLLPSRFHKGSSGTGCPLTNGLEINPSDVGNVLPTLREPLADCSSFGSRSEVVNTRFPIYRRSEAKIPASPSIEQAIYMPIAAVGF